MGKLLALSGRKQSGKGTVFRFVQGLNTHAPVREFSFAEPLKRVAVEVLGLRPEQAFGTNEEKETLVPHLLWENFPVKVWCDNGTNTGPPYTGEVRYFWDDWGTPHPINPETGLCLWPKKGPMTGREALQYWGTEIYRKAYPRVWADACVRAVAAWHDKEPDGVAVVTDCRFPDEVAAVQTAGGKVVRLTRSAFDDGHPSEHALDPEVFDWRKFDFVLDNRDLGMGATCSALHPFLLDHGYVPRVPTEWLDRLLRGIDPDVATEEAA